MCYTTARICVFVLLSSYNLNEWGKFFVQIIALFFAGKNLVYAIRCMLVLFFIWACNLLSFFRSWKNTKYLNTKKRYWRKNNSFVLAIACPRAMKLLHAVVKVQKDKRQHTQVYIVYTSFLLHEQFQKITWTFFKNYEQF